MKPGHKAAFLLAGLMLALVCPGPLRAKIYPLVKEVPLETGLKDTVGIGYATVGGTGAFDLRYWLTDTFGLDGLLALDVNSHPGGTDAKGNNINNDGSLFGLGLGVKYNWKKPVEDVLAQFFSQVFFISGSTIDTTMGQRTSTNTSTVGLLLGAGFEAFLPAWRALSLEGMVGLSLAWSSSNSVNTSLSLNSGGLSVQGAGFQPFTGAIHYYF